jgi:hypothetical protein
MSSSASAFLFSDGTARATVADNIMYVITVVNLMMPPLG